MLLLLQLGFKSNSNLPTPNEGFLSFPLESRNCLLALMMSLVGGDYWPFLNCVLQNLRQWWLWGIGLKVQVPLRLGNLLFIQLQWIWKAKHMSEFLLVLFFFYQHLNSLHGLLLCLNSCHLLSRNRFGWSSSIYIRRRGSLVSISPSKILSCIATAAPSPWIRWFSTVIPGN